MSQDNIQMDEIGVMSTKQLEIDDNRLHRWRR